MPSNNPAPGKKGNSSGISTALSKPKGKDEEEAYATLTLKFFRKKPFEVSGKNIGMVTPGGLHKIMPRVYKELRKLRGKAAFDAERLRREERAAAVRKSEVEDIPRLKPQTTIPEMEK